MQFTIGEFRQIAPGIHLTTCEPANVNVGLVVGARSAMLIDAGASAEQGAALLAAARAVSPVPVTHVVITHSHWDHWFGLAGMPDVVSLAHKDLAMTEAHAEQVPFARGAVTPEPPEPTERFSIAKAVDLGDLRVELLHFGGAHTASDVLVWVGPRNVCFAGDLLEEAGDPQFAAESNISNWPTVLDGILGATNDETIFVPGHGQPVDRMFAFRQRAEIGMLYSNTEMLIHRGVKLADAAASDEWPFQPETLDAALPLIYAELEARGVKPRTHLPLL